MRIRSVNIGILYLCLNILIQYGHCFLWYSPISRTQTLEDCLIMKETQSPFYPTYCDRLLKKYNLGVEHNETMSESDEHEGQGHHGSTMPANTVGWGWSEWGEWIEDACPEVCGRRCRIRHRYCKGPYEAVCKNQGKTYDFEDCPALEEEDEEENDPNDDDTFQRTTDRTTAFMRVDNDGRRRRPSRRPRIMRMRRRRRP